MNTASLILGIISTIITLCVVAGGVVAFRGTVSKAASEVQSRVIDAMEKEVDVLRGQVEELRSLVTDMKQENQRQSQVVATIVEALKLKGIYIRVENDVVIVTTGNDTTSVRIKGT